MAYEMIQKVEYKTLYWKILLLIMSKSKISYFLFRAPNPQESHSFIWWIKFLMYVANYDYYKLCKRPHPDHSVASALLTYTVHPKLCNILLIDYNSILIWHQTENLRVCIAKAIHFMIWILKSAIHLIPKWFSTFAIANNYYCLKQNAEKCCVDNMSCTYILCASTKLTELSCFHKFLRLILLIYIYLSIYCFYIRANYKIVLTRVLITWGVSLSAEQPSICTIQKNIDGSTLLLCFSPNKIYKRLTGVFKNLAINKNNDVIFKSIQSFCIEENKQERRRANQNLNAKGMFKDLL